MNEEKATNLEEPNKLIDQIHDEALKSGDHLVCFRSGEDKSMRDNKKSGGVKTHLPKYNYGIDGERDRNENNCGNTQRSHASSCR